jgi:holliday junction DNA helicase RuvA
MIACIKGKIRELEFSKVILETNSGISYEVSISFKAYEELKSLNETEIYIYHHITDRTEKLFGFMNYKDRELFKLIRSLNGIGEMTALKILSYLNAKELYHAVLNGNQSALEKIPKVKGKTSEKIIFEIKQNIKKLEQFVNENEKKSSTTSEKELSIQALVQLGFDEKTASKEVDRILKLNSNLNTAEIIKQVLST